MAQSVTAIRLLQSLSLIRAREQEFQTDSLKSINV